MVTPSIVSSGECYQTQVWQSLPALRNTSPAPRDACSSRQLGVTTAAEPMRMVSIMHAIYRLVRVALALLSGGAHLARGGPRHRDRPRLLVGPLDALEQVVGLVRANPVVEVGQLKVLERDDAKLAALGRQLGGDARLPLLALVLVDPRQPLSGVAVAGMPSGKPCLSTCLATCWMNASHMCFLPVRCSYSAASAWRGRASTRSARASRLPTARSGGSAKGLVRRALAGAPRRAVDLALGHDVVQPQRGEQDLRRLAHLAVDVRVAHERTPRATRRPRDQTAAFESGRETGDVSGSLVSPGCQET